MNLKTLFLSITAIGFATGSFAQDRLYKRNGDVIDGKVKSVDVKSVTYKRSDNPKGPDYTINKAEIEKVEYENGTEDVFDNNRKRSFREDDEDMEGREVRPRNHDRKAGKNKIKYGDNLITFAPANVTENGFGIGLSYEHSFGKKGFVSLYIPMSLSFGNLYDDIYYPGYNNGSWNTYTNFSFMIGPKFYPTGSKGKVRYAIAPVLAIVSGEKPADYYLFDQFGNPYYGNVRNFEFGGLLLNSLNMNPTKHLYIGLELGFGFTWINRHENVDMGVREMAQFAFKLGYRF